MSFHLTMRSPFRAAQSFRFTTPCHSLVSQAQGMSSISTKPTPSPSHKEIESGIAASEPQDINIKEWANRLDWVNEELRLPRNVQAIYLRPLRRKAQYGLPVCDLQLRSYNVQNLEFFADFALRAAYYLKLPVSGPVPLPRIVERWTVPRSNFVHKKSQENFERITLRRLIQIKDGSPQAVQAWLAFLRKHAFYGVGMKANVWEHESIDVIKAMDAAIAPAEKSLQHRFAQFNQQDLEPGIPLSKLVDTIQPNSSRAPLTGVRGH